MGDGSAMRKKDYEDELERLTVELVKLQEWVKAKGLKVVAIFEGRDAAGKGGIIKTLTEGMNPRSARIAALGVPTEREKTQWYFQRYVAQLPAGGELVFFDRSWYNRAGVEHVMGFCSDSDYAEFARSVPEFERMLIRSGVILIKYWFSVSDDVQEERFRERLDDPAKRWKLSPMDMTARSKWVDYSRAKDAMFEFSDTFDCPWHVVDANDKRCARLNTITHFLGRIPYKDLTPEVIELPPRQKAGKYARPPIDSQHWIPKVYPGKFARAEGSDDGEAEDVSAEGLAADPAAAPDDSGSRLMPDHGHSHSHSTGTHSSRSSDAPTGGKEKGKKGKKKK
jgi:polyphosphate kinase 2